MTDIELEKRLIQERIASHRQAFRAEIRSIRHRIRPASLLVSWSKRWVPLSRSIDTLTRMLGVDGGGRWAKWLRYASLGALAAPLIKHLLWRRR